MSNSPVPSDAEDDFDIYADLSLVNAGLPNPKNNAEEVQELKDLVAKLQSDLTTLRKSNETLLECNKNLSCNISVLFKTASSEIERKDQVIVDLRRQLDNMLFRRSGRKSLTKEMKGDEKAEVNVEALKSNLKERLDTDAASSSSNSSSHSPKDDERPSRCHQSTTSKENNIKGLADQKSPRNPAQVGDPPTVAKDKCKKKTVWERLGRRNSSDQKPEEKNIESIRRSCCATKITRNTRDDDEFSQEIVKPVRKLLITKSDSDNPPEVTLSAAQKAVKNASDSFTRTNLNVSVRTAKGNPSEQSQEDKSIEDDSLSKTSSVKWSEKLIPSPTLHAHNAVTNRLESVLKHTCPDKNETVNEKPSEKNDEEKCVQKTVLSNVCYSRSPTKPQFLNDQSNQWLNFQPPLPKEDPAPLPPLPVTPAPPTPIKSPLDRKTDKNTILSFQEHREEAKTTLSLSPEKTPQETIENTPIIMVPTNPQIDQALTKQIQEEKCIENVIMSEDGSSKSPSKPQILKEQSNQCLVFQPPLPKEDKAPLPPLPATPAPPTPIKSTSDVDTVQNGEKNVNLSFHEQRGEAKTTLFVSPKKILQETMQSPPNIPVPMNQQIDEAGTKRRWSDENLFIQCPFKPRCRVKSVVVLEDTTHVSNHITPETSGSPRPADKRRVLTSSSSCRSPEGKYQRPLTKKLDVPDNRVSSESRSYQTQRSMYNSRHLSSMKSFAHLPERRSPSELLNGRSGRIERIPHDDKIRVRLRDRRSRSLSPLGRKVRQDDRRTRNNRFEARDRRELSRNNRKESDKVDQRQVVSKAKSLSLKKPTESKSLRDNPVTKSKSRLMVDLFGESSPESEKKNDNRYYPCKTSNQQGRDTSRSACKNLSLSLSPNVPKDENNVGKKFDVSSKVDTETSSKAGVEVPNNCNVVVLKWRRRTNIRLENSETVANSVVINARSSAPHETGQSNEGSYTKTLENNSKPLSTSTPVSEVGNKIQSEPKGLKNVDSKTHKRINERRTVGTTPLYFREKRSKSAVGDESLQDACAFSDSEETPSSADSDVTYCPKRKRSTRNAPKRRLRQRR